MVINLPKKHRAESGSDMGKLGLNTHVTIDVHHHQVKIKGNPFGQGITISFFGIRNLSKLQNHKS